MFYDKLLDILGFTEEYVDDNGIWQQGEKTVIKTVIADVQPFSKELAYREYGFNEEISFRAFCDYDPAIELGTKVLYKDNRYIVKKAVDWDKSFMELLIDGI
jgi:hypothetical protein